MTLFDLALKNVRRNLRDYGLYVGSTIFSIVIYFTFVTLKYSEDISSLSETSKQISGVMSGSAFVLMIFVAIFITYSNSFFMKKRKKEVALYSLLGVRKKSIGFMLFFENLLIGICSLIVGIVLGVFMSQLLLMILIKLMGLTLVVGFAFSMKAILNTVIVFFIIFMFTSLQGYRVIYQFKLIDLFHASKKGDELPKARAVVAILGVLILAGAYWIAIQDFATSTAWRVLGISTPLVVIGMTIAGSYLLFHSVLVFVLTKLKNKESWAWKGLNVMTASQLLYRMRGNAKTLTIIATLSATTITAGGAVFGLYYNSEKEVQQYMPHTFMWQGEAQHIDSEDVLYKGDTVAKIIRIAEEGYDVEYMVIQESNFKKMAQQLAWTDVLDVPVDEVLLLDAYYNEQWSTVKEQYEINEKTYKVAKLYEKSVFNTGTTFGSVMVMRDMDYAALTGEIKSYQYVGMDNYKNHIAISKDLESKTEDFSSATQSYRDTIESLGALLFVGSFLGLVFLVATGSIIFFKMMTEAEEDKEKYAVLGKIGVSKKDMKRTIRGQVGLIFAAPLLLGLMHSAFALMAISNLFFMDILVPVIIWMIVYTVIYAIYYMATVRSFYNTVKGN